VKSNSLEHIVLIQIKFTTSPPTTINWHMHYILNVVYESKSSSLERVVLIQIRFTTSPPTTIDWHMRYILNVVYESNSVKSTFGPGNVFAYNTMPSKDTF
jgi:hypothetical protein